MRKEQKPAAEHKHFKAACKTSCVSKLQTDCSHMQTCPKELHKTCLSIHPKHIKFLLQEHMLGSLRAPHSQPTQAAEPPRIPWVTHKNLLLQKHKGWLMGFCIHSFSKLRQLAGCIFYMFQSEQSISIFWRYVRDPAILLRIYFKRNRHTFLPLNQQLNHMATASQIPMAFKKTIRYKIFQGRKLHGWKVPSCLYAA